MERDRAWRDTLSLDHSPMVSIIEEGSRKIGVLHDLLSPAPFVYGLTLSIPPTTR
jgi:hypothetical protein